VEHEVFDQRRAAQPGLQGVLVVADRHALVGCQRLASQTRPVRAGSRASDLDDVFTSLNVLADAVGKLLGAHAPRGGATAFSGPNSCALVALKGISAVMACTAAMSATNGGTPAANRLRSWRWVLFSLGTL
jgi:hypothetical protein